MGHNSVAAILLRRERYKEVFTAGKHPGDSRAEIKISVPRIVVSHYHQLPGWDGAKESVPKATWVIVSCISKTRKGCTKKKRESCWRGADTLVGSLKMWWLLFFCWGRFLAEPWALWSYYRVGDFYNNFCTEWKGQLTQDCWAALRVQIKIKTCKRESFV